MSATKPTCSATSGTPGSSIYLFYDGPSAPGFNKNLRDRSKYALAVTAVLLLIGKLHWACITSAYSIYNLKAGTAFSCKNFKWMALSIISFFVGLVAFVMEHGARFVDENRDYSYKIRLLLWAYAMRTIWWPTLGLFLFCTWGNDVPHINNDHTSPHDATSRIKLH